MINDGLRRRNYQKRVEEPKDIAMDEPALQTQHSLCMSNLLWIVSMKHGIGSQVKINSFTSLDVSICIFHSIPKKINTSPRARKCLCGEPPFAHVTIVPPMLFTFITQ